VVGVCEVARAAYPDPTALDETHKGFDPKAAADGEPRWSAMDVRLVRAPAGLPLPGCSTSCRADMHLAAAAVATNTCYHATSVALYVGCLSA